MKTTTTKNDNPGFENQAVKRAKSEMKMELKTQYPRNRTPGNTLQVEDRISCFKVEELGHTRKYEKIQILERSMKEFLGIMKI